MSDRYQELTDRVRDLELIIRDLATGATGAVASEPESAPESALPGDETPSDSATNGSGSEAALSRDDPGAADREPSDDWAPVAWSDRASSHEWYQLVAWVDWLRGTYDVVGPRQIPSCWPAHRGLANDLHGLWQMWIQACWEEHEGEKTAMLHWHDRWLPPFLARRAMYGIKMCEEGRHEEPMLPPPTRLGLIPPSGLFVTAAASDPVG